MLDPNGANDRQLNSRLALIRVHPWLKKKLCGSLRSRRLCVEGVSIWPRSVDFAWPTMIWQGVCYVELKESRQGIHQTQPGPPLKGNGCRRRFLKMQGQVPAAKPH